MKLRATPEWQEWKKATRSLANVKARSRSHIRQALVAGAKFYNREASRTAPEDSGQLKADFMTATENTTSYINVSAGPSRNTAYYARWLEYGTGMRFHKGARVNAKLRGISDEILAKQGLSRIIGGGSKRGKSVGRVEETRFMRHAWARSIIAIQYMIRDRFSRFLQTEVGTRTQAGGTTVMEG